MNRSGSCLCGAVKFTAIDVSSEVHACHCTMCRRWSGGPGLAVNVAGLEFQQDEQLRLFASSDWAQRGFCQQCGTNLFYLLTDPQQYMVWMGALDDQSGLTLSGEIFIDEKPPGYEFAGEHHRMTGEEFLASLG